jgi:hypothetical protein
VSTSEVPVTDTLSYAFNTGAVIIGVGSGVGSGVSGVVSGVVSGSRAGAGSVKGVGAGVGLNSNWLSRYQDATQSS